MLSKLLQRLQKPKTDSVHDAEVFNLQNQIKTLELQLQQQDQSIAELHAQLALLETQAEERIQALADQNMLALFEAISVPCAQLITQQYLHAQKKSVQVRDTLQITNRLIRELENAGLIAIGTPGQTTAYDPTLHSPLDSSIALEPGQTVTIKLVGFHCKESILLRAMVTALTE